MTTGALTTVVELETILLFTTLVTTVVVLVKLVTILGLVTAGVGEDFGLGNSVLARDRNAVERRVETISRPFFILIWYV